MVSKNTKITREKKKEVAEGALKEGELRDYELVLVISPGVVEEKFDATLGNLRQLITNLGGGISDVTQWGKRKLAYPVKHFSEGAYVLVKFKLKPTLSKELERKLHISEEVIRHLLTRTS